MIQNPDYNTLIALVIFILAFGYFVQWLMTYTLFSEEDFQETKNNNEENLNE